MASPSTVLSRGYGSWGSVNLVPTLGYGIGTVSQATGRLEFTFNRITDFTFPKIPDETFPLIPDATEEQP